MKLLTIVLLLVCSVPAFAGLGSNKSMYVGGTTASIPDKAEGILDARDAKTLTFNWNNNGHWTIPYDKVSSLSYGQHAGRRVGMAILISPVTLLSKKRRHYLTVEYVDATGANQAAIFEVGKDAIRTTLTVLEVRTGKKVEYQDEEARKAGSK